MCLKLSWFMLSLVTLAAGGCCVEGYPALRERDVALAEVPARVRNAFERGYDLDGVTRVEQTSFKSFCAGDEYRYRFHLADGQTITLDQKARLARWQPGRREK